MIVYLDANIVIYLVERDPTWGPRALARIAALRSAGDEIAVSDVHRLECLVGLLILSRRPRFVSTFWFAGCGTP